QKLLSTLKEVIAQFKALGSHREKIHYVEDLKVLSYIYGKILYYIKGNRVPREFWEGLLTLIHEKTLVDEFHTIIEAKIDNKMLEDALLRLKEKISAGELISEWEVADAHIAIIRSLLEVDLANPVYKAIYDRIERAREEWIARNIDAEAFLHELLTSMSEKRKYDETIAGKPIDERVVETINLLVNQHFNTGEQLTLELAELRQAISEVMKAAKIIESHENRLRTALMKDLFREFKKYGIKEEIIPRELKNFAERVTREYIIKEIEKARKQGRAAS
ncbi:MAG: hypothetical protein ACK4H7_05050, partial [Acidilobaceae archaeon]